MLVPALDPTTSIQGDFVFTIPPPMSNEQFRPEKMRSKQKLFVGHIVRGKYHVSVDKCHAGTHVTLRKKYIFFCIMLFECQRKC